MRERNTRCNEADKEMTKVFHYFRKRSREEDDSNDLPLSKRINNLHLTNNGVVLQEQQQQQYPPPHDQPNNVQMNGNFRVCAGPSNEQQHTNHQHLHQNGHHHQGHHSLDDEGLKIYDPELSMNENPHYFHKNKLLYELHFTRMARKCNSQNIDL